MLLYYNGYMGHSQMIFSTPSSSAIQPPKLARKRLFNIFYDNKNYRALYLEQMFSRVNMDRFLTSHVAFGELAAIQSDF